MQTQTDREYFARRAIAEWRMSTTATDPNVGVIHEQLADHYEKMVADGHRPRPKLSI